MRWLRTRIQGRKLRHEDTADEPAERQHQASEPLQLLILLVQDAARPGSYRLHTFEDAASAEAFVQFWFSKRFDHGIIAFWATHEEPVWRADGDEGPRAEVAILIRDEVRQGIVYPFSLSNMAMAHSWMAKEAAQGLKLRQVLLYWGTPVRIATDHWGRVRVTPREPPTLRRPLLLRSSTVVVRENETPSRESDVRPERAGQPREAPAEPDDVADAAPTGEAADAPDGARTGEVSDILEEVERLVQRRQRRLKRDEPFRGFGSPPGKF